MITTYAVTLGVINLGATQWIPRVPAADPADLVGGTITAAAVAALDPTSPTAKAASGHAPYGQASAAPPLQPPAPGLGTTNSCCTLQVLTAA